MVPDLVIGYDLADLCIGLVLHKLDNKVFHALDNNELLTKLHALVFQPQVLGIHQLEVVEVLRWVVEVVLHWVVEVVLIDDIDKA